MGEAVVRTKLAAPRPRPWLVERARLTERITQIAAARTLDLTRTWPRHDGLVADLGPRPVRRTAWLPARTTRQGYSSGRGGRTTSR